MNVLVVGGTGLVGQYLVKRLLDLGHSVQVLTRDAKNVTTSHPLLSAIITDISQEGWVEKSHINLGQYHVIYHLAYAITEDESYNRKVTVESVKVLLSELERLGKIALQHFVYVGSMSVFGMAPKDEIVNEGSDKIADSSYASNKIEATRAVLNCNAGFLTTVLHPTCVYDTHSNRIQLYQDMLKYNYIVTLNGGRGNNNIVHADDVAMALVGCLGRLKSNKSEEYLINGEAVVYSDWFKWIEEAIGVQDKKLAPAILRMVYKGAVRGLLNRAGFRCPLYLPHYKLLIYENRAFCSSEKANKDFAYNPTRRLNESGHFISAVKKGQSC